MKRLLALTPSDSDWNISLCGQSTSKRNFFHALNFEDNQKIPSCKVGFRNFILSRIVLHEAK